MKDERLKIHEDVMKAMGYWAAVHDIMELLKVGDDGRPLQGTDLARAILALAEGKHSQEKLNERAKNLTLGRR